MARSNALTTLVFGLMITACGHLSGEPTTAATTPTSPPETTAFEQSPQLSAPQPEVVATEPTIGDSAVDTAPLEPPPAPIPAPVVTVTPTVPGPLTPSPGTPRNGGAEAPNQVETFLVTNGFPADDAAAFVADLCLHAPLKSDLDIIMQLLNDPAKSQRLMDAINSQCS